MGLFSRRKIGDDYESLARRYLEQKGLQFLKQNFQAKCGEIDLIMRDKQQLVFVEVKYRQSNQYGHALEMITPSKQRKIIKTATLWLMKNGLSPHTADYRFDAIGIENSGQKIDWVKNAIYEG